MQADFLQVTTQDEIDLQGLIFTPDKATDTVGLWVHGLTSSFHSSYKRLTTLAQVFNEKGLAFASFDTRGHDIVSKRKRTGERKRKGYGGINIGSAYEKFDQSVLDLEAVVNLLKSKFKHVVLIGHSTGANKVIYYATRIRFNKILSGIVLVSPVNDRPGLERELGKDFEKALNLAKTMVKKGKQFELMPQELVGSLYTAQRFVSLADEDSVEHIFPYLGFSGPLKLFERIRQPILIVIGDKDSYLDYPVEDHLERLETQTTSHKFASKIIYDADHSFDGREEELAQVIASWVSKILL